MNNMNPLIPVITGLFGGILATLAGVYFKSLFDARSQKKDRVRKAVEPVWEKLWQCHGAMEEVLKNSPPENDPHDTERVNISRAKREEFERTLELQKLHLPDDVVSLAKGVCIQISRVVNDNMTWKEMRGTPNAKDEAKKYWEASQKSQDFLREKMDLLEKRLQKLLK